MIELLKKQRLTNAKIPWHEFKFLPVMNLPTEMPVFDFSVSYDPDRTLESPYGVGRYNEHRPTMYSESSFTNTQRTVHMGVDLASPAQSPVYAFADGKVLFAGDNQAPQDYGPTLITEHHLGSHVLYALYGHLSRASLLKTTKDQVFSAGACLGWLGASSENGGWNPHLHFQLSLVKPMTFDLPGVVSLKDRAWAIRAFPDPRMVLGPLY